MERRKLFFTGFPGFIGTRLVHKLMEVCPGCEFVFLVLPAFVPQATAALKSPALAKVSAQIIAGDIAQDKLGLEAQVYQELAATITDVFHLAAIYDLAVPEALARKVNVVGTQHVLELAQAAGQLQRLVYYSTCFVAGRLKGTVYEDDLPTGQVFKNHYEATKHEAEKLVREKMATIPTIIIRPAIVVGESSSGITQKFDGPYFCMILVDRLRGMGIPLPRLGPSLASINIVPVDFVTAATAAIWQKPGTTGKCYALADPNPFTTGQMYRETIRLMGAMGPIGAIPPALFQKALQWKKLRKFLKVPAELIEYFNHDVRFDTRNTSAALAETGVACPPILSYFPQMVQFYRHNRHRKELYWRVV